MESVTGYCEYCRQPRIVQVKEDTLTQEDYNKIATWECDCDIATEKREREIEERQVKENIKKIIEPVNNAVADAMIECIGILESRSAKKVTINTDYGVTYRMAKTAKGVKVSLTTNETKEIDT